MEDTRSPCEQAIGAILFCTKEYTVQFNIAVGSKSGKYKLNSGIDFWRIVVMQKQFIDIDFVQCVRKACAFVVQAHGEKI